jgi:hypothetical protein
MEKCSNAGKRTERGVQKKKNRGLRLPLLQTGTAILLELSLWFHDLQGLL